MVVVSSTFSPPPAEGILVQTPSTKLLINDQELGTATLYITEQDVVWGGGFMPSGIPAPSVSLSYPNISLHAVQREPSPALYMLLNYDLRLPELPEQQESVDTDEDEDFETDEHPTTQIRFIPENENDLQALYSAMSQGQSLHPDPEDALQEVFEEDDPYMDGEEIDEEDEEFEDAEESNSHEEAAARLRQLRLGHPNANGTHCDDDETSDADVCEE